MNTALIIRPADSPKLWALEVDGPRRKYVQRGEGSYYLQTDNHPHCDDLFWNVDTFCDLRLKDWDSPHWEIYQQHDGSIEVHSCRPTTEEAMEGDLHGALGSVIKLTSPTRWALRNALRLARRLCHADPTVGLLISRCDLIGIITIESDIPVYLQRAA